MLEWLFGKKKEQPKQEKKRKSQKQTEQEDRWMYDFMVQFLSSPIWRVSILDFVDNKCIVFDNQEENKFEYTIIHNEFKQLVGNLVDGMMVQVGMSEEKLAENIQKGFQSKERKLFNQLLLADDFTRFKDLMLKRNKALEQEAIKAIQQGNTGGNQSSADRKVSKLDQQRQLIRQSKRAQQERQNKMQEEEDEMMRKALQMSRIQSNQNEAMKQLERKAEDQAPKVEQKIEQQHNTQPKQQVNIKESSNKPRRSRLEPLKEPTKSGSSQFSDLPPLKGSILKSTDNKKQQQSSFNQAGKVVQQRVQPEVKPLPVVVQQSHQVPLQDQEPKAKQQSMQQRKQRLMAQRQKIRKQKQEQRRKQLQQEESSLQKLQQPHQQVTHTVVLQQDGIHDTNLGLNKEHTVNAAEQGGSISNQDLKRRKQLMNRIKNRIIDDF